MYVSEKRSLQLVEIQDSVLPEDEWLIGISDMTYFRGVGFSMPTAFGEYQNLQREPLISSEDSGYLIAFESVAQDSDSYACIIHGAALTEDSECEQIQPSSTGEESGLHLVGPDELQPSRFMRLDIEPVNLYAFLPGLFYVSNERTSVDAVLIEVTQSDMLGMTLSSFRPESVRTFDVTENPATDGRGKNTSVPTGSTALDRLNMDLTRPKTGSARERTTGSIPQRNPAYSVEIDTALRLGRTVKLEELKRVYFSGVVVPTRFAVLLADIEFKGLKPRYRVYVRNRKYPSGKVIDARYLTLDNILYLNSETGLECPEDIDVSTELSGLTFSSLGTVNKEVSIEEAIMEYYEFMLSEFGNASSSRRIAELVLSEAGN